MTPFLVTALKESRRNDRGESANAEGHRQCDRNNAAAVTRQSEIGLKVEGILRWVWLKVDLELGAEGAKRDPLRRRHDGDRKGDIARHDRRHHRVGGGGDHRNIAGERIRDIGVFPIRSDGDPKRLPPHRDWDPHHRVGGRGDHRDGVR